MSSTVIRDFLVSLGFTTDNEGARKMGDALDGVTKKSVVLKTALLALATGTVAAVAKTASELDKLYYSSQRIGASAENIRAYGDAVSQMGGDSQSALQSLESVAQKMRNSPGYEGMLQGLGVATRDSNGAMRDRVEVMKDLSKTFKDMPTYQANAYASSLGIDEKTMLAMRDGKFVDNMEKYQKIRSQVGLDDDLAKSGSELMTEFNDTAIMTKAITEVVVMTAGKALLPILKLINKALMTGIEMFDSLNPNIKTFLAVGLKIATVAVVFGGLIGVLSKIGTVLPLLKGLLFLIRGLNLAFLASPIGIVLALASAIALLWDDYKTWKEGGESLIDWSKWSAGIETAIEKIGKLVEWIGNLKDKVIDITVDMWEKAKNKIFNETTEQVVEEVKEKTQKVTDAVAGHTQAVAGAAAQVLKATASIATGGFVGGGKGNYAFSFGKDVDSYIAQASKKYGIDEKILRGFVKMEAGWTGKMSPTGAIGTGQFIKSTWNGLVKTKEGQEIGMTKINKSNFRKSNDPRYDKKINTLATGLLAKQNADVLRKYGVPITGENLYLSHNIGAVTFARALTGKANAKGLEAMRNNGMKKGETPKQFVDRQRAIYQKHYNQANKVTNENTVALARPNTEFTGINNSQPNTNAMLLPNNYSASNNAKTVTIHQNYKSEMHINGAENPQMTANAIKRENENNLTRLAHNAKGVMA